VSVPSPPSSEHLERTVQELLDIAGQGRSDELVDRLLALANGDRPLQRLPGGIS
jgi:hypothetical protein